MILTHMHPTVRPRKNLCVVVMPDGAVYGPYTTSARAHTDAQAWGGRAVALRPPSEKHRDATRPGHPACR